jgi:4a-hydroxytetrahydrobiopterin dehydratase
MGIRLLKGGQAPYALGMKLTSERIEEGLRTLAGWQREGDAIRRQFTFAGFPEAVAFVVRVGFGAEAVDHHPDILVNYKRVTLTYTTHSEGGLTEKDLAGARAADAVAAAMGSRS